MTRKELRTLLKREIQLYNISNKYYDKRFRHTKNFTIWRAVKQLRKYEYLISRKETKKCFFIDCLQTLQIKFAVRKLNKISEKTNLELTPNKIKPGLRICHNNVIIFGNIGMNCTFHGNNVVGNKRTGASEEIPTLGNNIDVGYGAIIIGKIQIADNCVIGAGAVVTKSCNTPGTILAGNPARPIK